MEYLYDYGLFLAQAVTLVAAILIPTSRRLSIENPGKVQQIANVLTSLFLEENLKVREKAVEETSAFLESEMAKIQKDLTAVESRIEDFTRKHMSRLHDMYKLLKW